MAELDTRFNLDPARLNPSQDSGDFFLKGFSSIGDTIQRNKNYAATLQEMRDRRAAVAAESEWRREQAKTQADQWAREQARADDTLQFYKDKEAWDEAHPTGSSLSQWEEVPDPNDPTGQHKILKARTGGFYDEEKRKSLAAAAARTPGTKLLPQPVQAELTADGQDVGNIARANTKWKPDYAGTRAFGEAGIDIAGGIFNSQSAKDAQDWWADYRANVSSIKRNRLYGASLTDNERDDFDRNDIHPGMRPEQIKRNLDRQRDLLRIAATRKAGGLIAQGAEPTAVEQYLHVHLEDLGFKIKRDPTSNKVTEITEFPAIEGMALGVGGPASAGVNPDDLGGSQ